MPKKFTITEMVILAGLIILIMVGIAILIVSIQTANVSQTIVVDYDLPLNDSIVAGKYNNIDGQITEDKFPPQDHERGKVELEIKLFGFAHNIEWQEVLEEMEDNGYRPATLRELLAFEQQNPKLKEEFTLVSLGSDWTGEKLLVYFPEVEKKLPNTKNSAIILRPAFIGAWFPTARFLGVRMSD